MRSIYRAVLIRFFFHVALRTDEAQTLRERKAEIKRRKGASLLGMQRMSTVRWGFGEVTVPAACRADVQRALCHLDLCARGGSAVTAKTERT